MRKLACPPAAGSARDHFSDADYKTKDGHGQTVSINMSFLVKDTVPPKIFFSAYDHASTDYSATRKRQISEGRAMRRKRRAETRLVNWITVTIVTYHYDYNIVPPQQAQLCFNVSIYMTHSKSKCMNTINCE